MRIKYASLKDKSSLLKICENTELHWSGDSVLIRKNMAQWKTHILAYFTQCIENKLAHFMPIFHFYTPVKTTENHRFSTIFRGPMNEQNIEVKLIHIALFHIPDMAYQIYGYICHNWRPKLRGQFFKKTQQSERGQGIA